MAANTVDVRVTMAGKLWLAHIDGAAGGISAHSLKELYGDIAEALPFLFPDRDQPPTPVYHYFLDGLSAQDLNSFAELQRRAAAIADDYTRTLKERVAQLHQQGLSDGDIGQLLGLTKQRIQQVRPKTGREARQSA
ncbi:hypothetical protein ACTMTF_22335 [Nonomuraea sp. ZG12]|uniref:hypothetical protein n=1 Tax=Nonomuraea sp. ZG12 TaxID=3452207 RepID=UPI003F890759